MARPVARSRRPHPLPPLGAHVSAAGGLVAALGRGEALGCTALQVFVKSPSQWRGRTISTEEAAAFRGAHAASAVGPVVAHAAYLINIAAPGGEILERSRAALADELDRCASCGLDALVLHPGAHLGAGVESGIERAAASLDAVVGPRPAGLPRLLLELTAGQGSVLGRRLEELARLVESCACGDRLGICVDTCHAFAAGYALDEEEGYEAFWQELETSLGLGRLGAIHLNDSVGERGSRRDRHANLGEGKIGLGFFARLLADPRLAAVPMLLETPMGDDGSGHARDLAVLRGLAAASAVEGTTAGRGVAATTRRRA